MRPWRSWKSHTCGWSLGFDSMLLENILAVYVKRYAKVHTLSIHFCDFNSKKKSFLRKKRFYASSYSSKDNSDLEQQPP
jgi:hypothetical protein